MTDLTPTQETIATITASYEARDEKMQDLLDYSARTGRIADLDEYRADVNERHSTMLGMALLVAGDAGKLLAVLGDSDVADSVGPHLNCGEADRVAYTLHLLGQTYAAARLLEGHAIDDEGDAHRYILASGDGMVETATAHLEALRIARNGDEAWIAQPEGVTTDA